MSPNQDLKTRMIKALKEVATVRVDTDMRESGDTNSIVVNTVKMSEIADMYEFMSALVSKCWSNLPPPPVDEKTYLIAWTIACEGYDVNHRTIKWDGATLSTFVHMWAIIDRIKPSVEKTSMAWIMSGRSCVDFCAKMNVTGPADSHMYVRTMPTPVLIENMKSDPSPYIYEDLCEDHDSFYDFTMSARMRPPMPVVDVSKIIERNNRIERELRAQSGSSTGPSA